MNRLLSRHVGTNGTVLESYGYSLTGQRSTRVDGSGSYAWNYDLRDRVTAAFSPAGTLNYAHDQAGNLTNVRSSTINGVWLSYQYDTLNRVTNVTDHRLTGTGNTRYGFATVLAT